ncbi:MAG TPA: DNA polymerase I [Candidatus Krumholzibacteria bacterium]|nr:DNA polymerase I [Candidatus Krumholzibacteria bacterium]HPD71708.1 DNA polymerase I [Candidatus Krumholzibacteria bacterium]HRY41359.1 DNA polymerase I [Candidatus Krumholzibacteria bacterium]
MNPTLILIDGSALVYRAHYAFANRPLTSPSGEVTSVVFGTVNVVLQLVERYAPSHLAMVFDLKGPTFRNAIYPQYKANRKPMPDELAAQLPRLREVLAAWRLPVVEVEGYEADDVMATVARRSAGVVDRVWHYTGDKDFQQLLDARIGLLKPGRRGDDLTEVTLGDLERELGLSPAQVIDCFALAGDKSDNIPGAPGVGDKTALKLIREFGDLETLFERLERSNLTPRLKRVIGENRDQILLSRRLFTIDQDVPLDVDWDALRTVLPTSPDVAVLLDRLGLQRGLRRAEKLAASLASSPPSPPAAAASGPAEAPQPRREPAAAKEAPAGSPADEGERDGGGERLRARGYLLLATDDSLREWLAQLPAAAPLAIDTETDDLVTHRARLVGISLAAAGLPPAYVPVRWRVQDADPARGEPGSLFALGEERERLAAVRAILGPVLADPARLKVGQNLKFDLWILERNGLPVCDPLFDTMLASYVLDPGRLSHGLEELARLFLHETMIGYDEMFARGDRRQDILGVPLPRLAEYAAEDADVTWRLYSLLDRQLAAAGLADLFRDLEMPLLRVLLAMERAGIKIDRSFLGELEQSFAAELADLERRIHALAGEEFNVQSPKQLAVILFDKLGLKPLKKTASGWSTDVTVLERLAEDHDLPRLVLEHRQVAKLQGTYVTSLPELADADGLIHTSYNQAVAATGRLSSSDPNLQNIPIRTELGRRIRRAFIPRSPDNVFLSADYSQVELRLLAHLSGDATLCQSFRDGADVHRRTAALVGGVAETAVTPQMRSRAKAINFGVVYGMGARALARQIQVKQAEAQEFIDRYFATYPGVRAFIDATKERARRDGYVETMLGRRRLLPDILSPNHRLRSFQERIAVNTPIQGTAADLIKLAMLRLAAALREEGGRALMLLQVHDELVLEVPEREVAAVTALVKRAMEGALSLAVPLVVDVHAGRDWREAHG